MAATAHLRWLVAAMAATVPVTAVGAPQLCLASMAWRGLDDDGVEALRERLALALERVGVESASTAESPWCDGTGVGDTGVQGQIFVLVEQSQAAARVQLKVVDAASTATVYLRTVGCPARDFPRRIDFETAFETALLALRRPLADQGEVPARADVAPDLRAEQAALRARARARAIASATASRRGPPPLAIAGWATAGLSGALALVAIAAGAQSLVLDATLRQRANAGGCIRTGRGQYEQCDRALGIDVAVLSVLVWSTNALWASTAAVGGAAAVLLLLGYLPAESREEAPARAWRAQPRPPAR